MISSFHISLRLLMSGFFIVAFSLSASSAIAQSFKPGRIVWIGHLEHQHSYADAYNRSRAQNTVKYRYVEETDSNGNTRLVEHKIDWMSSGEATKKGATIFDLRSGQYMRRFTGDCSVTCEQSPRGGGEVDLLSDDVREKLEKLKPQCKVTPSPDDYQCLYLGGPNVWYSIGSDIINMVPIPWEKLRDDCSYSEEKSWTDSSGNYVQRFSVWVSPEIDAIMKVETSQGSEYAQFVPEPGKQITFSARSNIPARFRFKLEEVSRFPGFATNAQIKPYFFQIYGLDHLEGTYEVKEWGEPPMVDPDLIFDPKLYEDRTEWEQRKYETVTTAKEVGSASVTITAMDYAAYGRLKAEVKGKCGGWEPVRILVGGQENDFVTIPMDEDENLIADKMDEQENGITDWGYKGETGRDDDKYPHGDGTPGDGLTAFEEYRGFMTRGVNFASGCDDRGYDLHVRTDPAQKDLFINSPDLELGQLAFLLENSTKQADDAKGIGVHLICEPHSVGRSLNYTLRLWGPKEWRGKTLFGGEQHLLNLIDGQLPDGTLGETRGTTGLGPPKYVSGDVKIDKNKIFSMGNRRYFNAPLELAKTVTHELGHALGIDHHGDSNIYLALLITDKPCPEDISDPLEILGEGVSIVAPELPAGEKACVIYHVARRHAQNSGNQECPMKYTFWTAYESPSSPLRPFGDVKLMDSQRKYATLKGYRGEIHSYRIDLDVPGLGHFCDKATGTGINGFPGEANHAGDSCRVCAGQIRVKDWGSPQPTPPTCPSD